jgi:predicted Zn-dependent protease
MQLREMRFARIDGTEVLVEVKSEKEAKAAIKELRHKKKELALLKRRLAREEARARRTIQRAENEAERESRRRGLFATLRRVSRAFKKGPALPDVDAIEKDLEKADEILHNIDSCIIQLEGRLLG